MARDNRTLKGVVVLLGSGGEKSADWEQIAPTVSEIPQLYQMVREQR